jgi:hypothetical protein
MTVVYVCKIKRAVDRLKLWLASSILYLKYPYIPWTDALMAVKAAYYNIAMDLDIHADSLVR